MEDKVLERLVNLIALGLECKHCPCATHKDNGRVVCPDVLYCSDILQAWVVGQRG